MSAPVWRKTSRSSGEANTDCVEVAKFPSAIGIRDSKNPSGGNLSISDSVFAALLDQIRRGELDR